MKKKKPSLFSRIQSLFLTQSSDSIQFYEELEDIFIENDFGLQASHDIVEKIKKNKTNLESRESCINNAHAVLRSSLIAHTITPSNDTMHCILIFGVNGVGKTTSIAKLGHYWKNQNKSVVFAAADTFRAAAGEQLAIHGQRLGIPCITQDSGADPSAVIYDSIDYAHAKKANIILADTAGRMHNKTHLMAELEKIERVTMKKITEYGGICTKILVIDANTGQNALQQAELFHEIMGIDALILSKYDAHSGGGIVVPIYQKLGIPIAFIGTGEHYEDLEILNVEKFVARLFDMETRHNAYS